MALDRGSRRVVSPFVFLMGSLIAGTALFKPPPLMGAEPQDLSATLLDVDAQKVPLSQSLRWRLSQAPLKEATVTLLGPNGPTPVDVDTDAGRQEVRMRPRQDLLPGSRYTAFIADARQPEKFVAAAFTTATYGTEPSAGDANAPQGNSEGERPSVVRLTTGADVESASLATTDCDNSQLLRGYRFCHKDGDVRDGIFTPGLNNTNGRWRVNIPSPALPKETDFRAGTFPVGETSLFGVLRRIDDKPLAKATVSLGDLSTTTDTEGRFVLTHVPAGHAVLLIDGSTANRQGEEYGQFLAAVEVQAKKANRVPFTLYVPRITAKDKVAIPSPTLAETVIMHPAIPGLEIHIPAGVVLRDRRGKVLTEFSIVPMPVDRSPVPVPENFLVYFSTQPGGASVEGLSDQSAVGIRTVYPNYSQSMSGETFWYYDAEHKGWSAYSGSRVSDDGLTIVPTSNWGGRTFMPEGGGPSTGGPKPGKPTKCGSGGASAGDPVDCFSGTFLHSAADLVVNDITPLAFTRTYNSSDTVTRSLGRGMSNSYGMYLYAPEATCFNTEHAGNELDLVTADGSVYPFYLPPNGTSIFSIKGSLVLTHTGTPSRFYGATLFAAVEGPFYMQLTDGTVYVFNAGCPSTLASVTDRFGNTTSLSYTAGLLSQISSASGRSLSFTYNSNNEISRVSDNTGRSVSYAYNTANQLSTVTYPDNTTEQYTYDASGNMLTVVDRRGNTMVTNQYDGNGRVTKQTYPDSSTFQFAYTVSGGSVSATDVTDGNGNVKHLVFDAAGYPTSITRAYGTSVAQTTSYTRGVGELITSITDPLGRVTAMTYDSVGNVLTRTLLSGTANAQTYTYTYTPDFHRVATVTDPLSHTTTFGYTNGCLTSVKNALGNTSLIACNGMGQPVSITDALGHTTTLSYTGTDLSTVTDPLNRTTTFSTDGLGRTIAVRDPLGHLSRVAYDALDRMTQSTDPLGQSTSYSYDNNGNLASVTDPNGGKTQFSYDARNRPTGRTDALNQSESVTLDNMGNVLTYTDRKGQQTSYQYDALNRASKLTYADTSTVTPTYDTGNRVSQIVDSVSGTITRSYDNFDRLTQEQTPQGSVSYTYDAVGRRATMTPGSQAQITYTYDNADRLTQIQQGSETVSIAYDAANRRTSLTLPNGVVTSYTYDAGDQVTGITYQTASGTTLSNLAYTYDLAGRRLSQTGGFLPDVPATATTAAGTFDLNNRQTHWNGMVLGYDNNGDPTSNAVAGQSYTFDARQNLTKIQNSGTGATLATFTYDPLGRRTGKTIGGSSTSFAYDGLNPVQETQGTTNYSILTGLGIDERYARSESAGRYYFLTDALGSTLALTDSGAAVQQKYAYEPYGESISTGASNNPYQYTGRENDGTGLYYYRARYYSPSLKRFISEDPMGLAAGLNSYAYADGDPIDFYDPYGLYSWGEFINDSADFSAGMGDTLSFGITRYIRSYADIGSVNRCSGLYSAGKWTGDGLSLAFGGAHLGRAALNQGWRRVFADGRSWGAVQRTWSRAVGGYKGEYELHHWFTPQSFGGSNAGWNYLAVTPWLNRMMSNGGWMYNSFKASVVSIYGAIPTSLIESADCGCN